MDYGRSKGRPPAETTLNIELGCAKVMLEWGVDHGYLSHNPLRKTRRAKTKGPRKTWLRESDLQRLLDAPEPKGRVQRLTLRAFILVIFDTGLRFEEARRLRRDRARERDEFDEITGDSAIGWVVDIDETKNRKAHTVGLTPRAWDALHALGEVPGSPYFFTRPETKALWGERTIRWWFRRACEESGVDALVAEGEIQVRPHDGRRSAATNAHNRGGSLLEVQRMLNHTSPAITAQYVQQNEANAIRMARIMEDGAARERRRRPPKRVCEGETQTAKSERTGTA
jgi:integrase